MWEFESVSSTSATHCRNLKFCVEIYVEEKNAVLERIVCLCETTNCLSAFIFRYQLGSDIIFRMYLLLVFSCSFVLNTFCLNMYPTQVHV